MKKIFTLLCVALAAVSCIDDDYDLGKVETGNITIGGDQTAFEMPLAQIVIGMTELRNGSSDVKAIFEEADIWLPSTLRAVPPTPISGGSRAPRTATWIRPSICFSTRWPLRRPKWTR